MHFFLVSTCIYNVFGGTLNFTQSINYLCLLLLEIVSSRCYAILYTLFSRLETRDFPLESTDLLEP